jgi:hypothetical protein
LERFEASFGTWAVAAQVSVRSVSAGTESRHRIDLMTVRPFISYAREDRAVASQLYRDLRANGAQPWMDAENLLGGEEWEPAVRRAIAESSHFVALVSAQSVNKRGFVQKELRQALEALDTFPPGETFVIPVRVDASEPRHERLARLHWIDLFPEYLDGFRRLLRSLRLEGTTLEPVEYSSHGPLTPNPPHVSAPPVRKDEDGFLTADAVGELVLARVQGRQRLRTAPILLFENSHQRTWLVFTERVIACVLDDTEKSRSYDPLRWYCRHRFALPVEVEPYEKAVGLIHLGTEHPDWLYSLSLHPDALQLKVTIETLLQG